MSVNFQTQNSARFNDLGALSENAQNPSQKVQNEVLQLVVLLLQQVMKATGKDGSGNKAGGADGASGSGGATGANENAGTGKDQGIAGLLQQFGELLQQIAKSMEQNSQKNPANSLANRIADKLGGGGGNTLDEMGKGSAGGSLLEQLGESYLRQILNKMSPGGTGGAGGTSGAGQANGGSGGDGNASASEIGDLAKLFIEALLTGGSGAVESLGKQNGAGGSGSAEGAGGTGGAEGVDGGEGQSSIQQLLQVLVQILQLLQGGKPGGSGGGAGNTQGSGGAGNTGGAGGGSNAGGAGEAGGSAQGQGSLGDVLKQLVEGLINGDSGALDKLANGGKQTGGAQDATQQLMELLQTLIELLTGKKPDESNNESGGGGGSGTQPSTGGGGGGSGTQPSTGGGGGGSGTQPSTGGGGGGSGTQPSTGGGGGGSGTQPSTGSGGGSKPPVGNGGGADKPSTDKPSTGGPATGTKPSETTPTTGSGSAGKVTSIPPFDAEKIQNETIVVKAGQTFDGLKEYGKMMHLKAGPALGDGGQGESQKPLFVLEPGATLKNVQISGADGIHTMGDATIDGVFGRDVGEDFMTKKGEGDVVFKNGGASNATDKTFQLNHGGAFSIDNSFFDGTSKLVRTNGGKDFATDISITNSTIRNVKEAVVRTDATQANIKLANNDISGAPHDVLAPAATKVEGAQSRGTKAYTG